MLSSASQACPDLALRCVALALQQTRPVCTGPGGGRGVGSLTRGNLRERWLSRGVRDTTMLRALRWQVQRETPCVDTCCLRLSLAKPGKVGAGGEPGFHVHLLPCGPVSTSPPAHPACPPHALPLQVLAASVFTPAPVFTPVPARPRHPPCTQVSHPTHPRVHPSFPPCCCSLTCSLTPHCSEHSLSSAHGSRFPLSVGCCLAPPMCRVGWGPL